MNQQIIEANKEQKIKKIYNAIRYLNQSEDAHWVETPASLVDKMISNVNLDGKILVLFNVDIMMLLLKVYEVPASDIVFLSDDSVKDKLCDKFGVKYINSIEELKEMNMKFDVVIGNPPYDKAESARNKKLWYTFSKMVLGLADTIAFVTPNAVVSSKGVNGSKLRNLIKEKGFGFVEAVNHVSPWFKNVGVDTCHWIIQKGIEDKVNPIQNDNLEEIDPIVISICDKVVSYPNKLKLQMINSHLTSKQCKETEGNIIYFSGDKTRFTKESVSNTGLKLVMPFSASYHKMFITEEATGQLNLILPIQNKEEGQYIIDYCQTPLFRFVAKHYKKTSGFTPFVKNSMVPDLRNETIEDIYNMFDLTQEEIDYVESNIK